MRTRGSSDELVFYISHMQGPGSNPGIVSCASPRAYGRGPCVWDIKIAARRDSFRECYRTSLYSIVDLGASVVVVVLGPCAPVL